jgi:acyl-coenzyme A synthetase/AMP-(fatty) acid ligase
LHVVLQSPDSQVVERCRDRLIAILSGQVTSFIPHVLTALPRTETSKVRRRVLAEMVAGMAV